jgi:hypothetical protein
MSKGDFVQIYLRQPQPAVVVDMTRVTASKAGRKVVVTHPELAGRRWVQVAEVDRGGKETGYLISVPADEVLLVHQHAGGEDD